LKLDNKLHEAKDNAISNGIATLKQLTLAVIVVGLIIAGYLFIRYRQTIEHTRELEESHARLLQLSDFRANFLAGMSHEFRTPLNAIKGFSELALMMGEKVPRAQINEYMQDINKAVSNLEHLIKILRRAKDSTFILIQRSLWNVIQIVFAGVWTICSRTRSNIQSQTRPSKYAL